MGIAVGAGAKLTPLRRLRIDPPRATAKASGVMVSLAWSLSPRPGEWSCWTWSAGPSCAGSNFVRGVSITELENLPGLQHDPCFMRLLAALSRLAQPGSRTVTASSSFRAEQIRTVDLDIAGR
jgi:hypothetical protein